MFTNKRSPAFYSQKAIIESDDNYKPEITDDELLNLVADENMENRYHPRENALAIMPSTIDTDKGILYQIKETAKGIIDDSKEKKWYVDDSKLLLLRNNGSVSVHEKQNVLAGNFIASHLSAAGFLNCRSLHSLIKPERTEPR